ncbi:hypothetical protein AURDEDRAFT_167655 [Auricularia subglabra TFB-10046 SS5]|nr:hypothetical protein AURDEDRAFT_167655 [Auricularia subglabra TFB-10046 SS5]
MSDVYCFLCGANAQVAATLEADIASAFKDACPGAPPPPKTSPFHFHPEDVKWQEDLALIGPINDRGEELVDPLESAPAVISAIDVKTVQVVYPIAPGDNHAYATVVHRNTHREYSITGNVFPFVHAGCYRIWATVLKQSPRNLLHPDRVLWAVIRRQNIKDPAVSGICGVFYGQEIERTQMEGDLVAPLANIQDALANFRYAFPGATQGPLPYNVLQCLAHNVCEANALFTWWRGPAAMWIFARPDAFPLGQAYRHGFRMQPLPPAVPGTSPLERLPVEILVTIVENFDQFTDLTSLLLVSKSVRDLCLTSMDTLVRVLAPEWMIPSPEHFKNLEAAGYPSFPWLKYAHYCRVLSPNMRNRWRIFGVCQQVLDIAEDMTDEELGQPPLVASAEGEEMEVDGE